VTSHSSAIIWWIRNAQDPPGHRGFPALLLARPMGQYCFARWHLSASVKLPGGRVGRRARGRWGGQHSTPWASRVTSHWATPYSTLVSLVDGVREINGNASSADNLGHQVVNEKRTKRKLTELE